MKFPLHQIINALEERAERGSDNELLSAVRLPDGSITIHIPEHVARRPLMLTGTVAQPETFTRDDVQLLASMGVSLA